MVISGWTRIWPGLATVTWLLLSGKAAAAAEYFVSPSGDDRNPGTLERPFASIAQGQRAAQPGDTIWLRGGVYEFVGGPGARESAVLLDKSGAPGRPIHYFAFSGETPVFDFFRYQPQARIRGISVVADYLHLKGIEIRGVRQVLTDVNESWGIRVEGRGGNFNVFEQLDLHDNQGPGLFIAHGGNNLVLNSDSHDNFDPARGGGNADGFGSHSPNNGNVFMGDRAWNNSDDGFDFINSRGVVVLERSWSWNNGFQPGTRTAAGNGAGIKAGGFLLDPNRFPPAAEVPRNVIANCVAFNNRAQGFYTNHHPGAIVWLNNTAFANNRGFDLINDVDPERFPAQHFLRNNISFRNKTDLINDNQRLIDDEFNTWNAGFAARASDFLSLSTEGASGPRQADGSLPDVSFLRLAPGSRLIDAGVDVGRPFQGAAPDLGALETSP
jgi:hypothetical protein